MGGSTLRDMEIEFPPGVTPSKPALVHRNFTSIVDVWRHYDPERADRREPAYELIPDPIEVEPV